jgi:hypothetical protein
MLRIRSSLYLDDSDLDPLCVLKERRSLVVCNDCDRNSA